MRLLGIPIGDATIANKPARYLLPVPVVSGVCRHAEKHGSARTWAVDRLACVASVCVPPRCMSLMSTLTAFLSCLFAYRPMILSTCSSSPALRARQHAQEAKNEYVEKSLVPELCASIEHVIGTRASVCSPMAVNSSLVRCEYVVNQYNLMYISLQLTPLYG